MRSLSIIYCFFLLIQGTVAGQTIVFPRQAIIKDSAGVDISVAMNNIYIEKISDTVWHFVTYIDPGVPLKVADIDIALRYRVNDAATLENIKHSFHWLPGINSAAGQIIPQHLFRSPAILFTLGKESLVLIPDIEALERNRAAPYYMQVQYSDSGLILHYGLSDYKVIPHQYYEKANTPFLLANKLQVSFYIMNPKIADPLTLLKMTNSALWKRFTGKYTRSSLPIMMNFSKYAEIGYTMALDHYWVDAVEGKGGITLSTYFDEETKTYRGRDAKDDLWFQAWFNNMRTAYGLYHYGKTLGHADWQKKALQTMKLLLDAPVNKGWFPTIYNTGTASWVASSQKNGTVYHMPDNAWAAYWLLRFSDELQSIKGADKWLVNLGNAILKTQNTDGSFPTMINAVSLMADSTLDHTASSAMATWYLEELLLRRKISADAHDRYANAVKRSLGFLSKEVLPRQKFEDFESYFSCSPKPMHYFDSATYLYAQNTLSIQWCAEAYLNAYKLFSSKSYLDQGEYCLNILSLYQQLWNPPFINFYAFGGFGVQNTDAEWSDARQAQFADTYLQYSLVTRKMEYRERAWAALNASFALMVLPQHKTICPDNYQGTSINGELWSGSMAENFGHSGYNKRSHQSGFHWGTGSALTTAAIFQKAGLVHHKSL